MTSSKLKKAATTAVLDYLGLQPDESFLVVTDENMKLLAEALFEVGKKNSRAAFFLIMPELTVNGDEPPNQLIDIMRTVDLVVAVTTKAITHTGPRHQATKGGVRVATIGEMDEEAFCRNMSADIDRVVDTTEALYDKFFDVHEVKITSDAGTDLKMKIMGRKPLKSTGVLRLLSNWGNLPSGEVYIAPIEEETNGVIVIDGSAAELGLIKHPITLEILDGSIVDISGKGAETKAFTELVNRYDIEGRTVCELGIGTNYKSEMSGFIQEDEKVLGTCHFGFGNNFSFGGSLTPPAHIDVVIMKPSIWFDNVLIMENGNLIL